MKLLPNGLKAKLKALLHSSVDGNGESSIRDAYPLFHNLAERCIQRHAETSVAYPGNRQLMERIIRFYATCYENTKIQETSLWKSITELKLDIHEALLHDCKGLSSSETAPLLSERILADPINSEFWYGFSEPTKSRYVPLSEETRVSWEYDVLYRLAQAWGCVPMSNPESRQPTVYPSVEELLDAMDQALGSRIPLPNVYPHIIGLKTPRGVVDYRAINGLYCAKKMQESGARKVLEIGAGLGWSAFYSHTLGVKDYTIVDIPITCVASAHFLGAALGPEHIALDGEASAETQIKILPPEAFPDGVIYDVILNIDSLTEMDASVARGYCERIKRSAKRFISINHEYHTYTIRQLISGDPRVKHQTRSPYWLRRGYVEEIFDFI